MPTGVTADSLTTDEPPQERDAVEPDRCGEIHLEFEDLAPGHGYGARWG